MHCYRLHSATFLHIILFDSQCISQDKYDIMVVPEDVKVMTINNRIYLMDIACLSPAAVYDEWYRKMPEYRREKIDRVKPERSKKLSLCAGILLERALNNCGITEYEVAFSSHGKPYIADHENIFFNISHSGEKVALAVSDREVGVDIQKLRHFDNSIINYVYNTAEQRLAKESGSEDAGMDMVYTRMWSMKEAFMKHSGLGIQMEPISITLNIAAAPASAACAGYDPGELYLIEYKLQDYALTVCTSYRAFAPDPETVTL